MQRPCLALALLLTALGGSLWLASSASAQTRTDYGRWGTVNIIEFPFGNDDQGDDGWTHTETPEVHYPGIFVVEVPGESVSGWGPGNDDPCPDGDEPADYGDYRTGYDRAYDEELYGPTDGWDEATRTAAESDDLLAWNAELGQVAQRIVAAVEQLRWRRVPEAAEAHFASVYGPCVAMVADVDWNSLVQDAADWLSASESDWSGSARMPRPVAVYEAPAPYEWWRRDEASYHDACHLPAATPDAHPERELLLVVARTLDRAGQALQDASRHLSQLAGAELAERQREPDEFGAAR